MFDFVRAHTRLLQGILVLLIFPSFVFFGVQGYSSFTDGKTATVAQVAGQAIKANELEAAHRQQIERMRQQMPNVDIKLLDTPQMRRETLDALIRERVLATAVQKDHLLVSDARLARLFQADPQLAALRNPDGTVNKDFLAARGMSSLQFAEQLRQDYAMRQVLQGVAGSSLAGVKVADAAAQALLDQREVQVHRFSGRDYLARLQPTDAELQAYYDAHRAEFQAPEAARIEYVVLDLEALKKQLTLPEEDLRKYYTENLSRYTAAEERRAAHILINAAADASADVKAKAKAKAQALLAEVRKNPASFGDVARKNSQDEGSAARGGDLDFFGRGAMVKPFEDAAFAMKAGEISELVESEFGFHIIRVTEIRGGERKSFESVRAQIVDEVSKQLAQKRYIEVAEQFSNMVYEQSDSLQPVIDKLKLSKVEAQVQRTPAPDAKGPLASGKLLDAVFSADSVKNKRNTEAVETGPNQMVSARIVEHKPEHVLPLAEVRARVLDQVKAEQAAALARKDGEARLAALRQNPADVLPQKAVVSRSDAAQLPRQVLEAALQADTAKLPHVQGIDLGAQGYVVLKVVRQVPRVAGDTDLARIRPSIAQALATAEADAYYQALKKRFKAEVKADELAAAAGAAASAAR